MSDQYEEQNTDSSGQDQTDGGAGTGGEGGGEENNEADMIFAPEASKPGRNAGMLMIAFVMIGVGVIYFMRARGGGPAPVSAEAIRAKELIDRFDGNQVKKMKDLLESTEKVVRQWDVDKNARPDTELANNPFKFVSPTDHGPTTDPNAKDKEQAKAKAQFLEGLDNMKVQYIMVSAFAKTAMINNKLVQEGQEVDGYAIDKITPQEVFFSKTIKSYGFKAAKSTSKELK
jgi:hypothetical protein